MRISNAAYQFIFEVEENKTYIVVCENPTAFYELIYEFNHLLTEGVSSWHITENDGEAIKPSTLDIIHSPFHFEINNKKILNKVYRDLDELIASDYLAEKQCISQNIVSLIDQASMQLCYHIDLAFDCEIKDILKIFHVALQDEGGTLLERISDYIRVIAAVNHTRCLCLIDLKRYLSSDDIDLLYKEAAYHKVVLLLLESKYIAKKQNEDIIIIDEDNCVITL